MKRIYLILAILVSSIGTVFSQGVTKMEVYCEIMCVQYNLFKGDVNALVDFGIADSAKQANGWIYNSETNKKMSFASPMSVFTYMSRRGWKYKDAFIVTEDQGIKGKVNVWHFILVKEFSVDCTTEAIIGDLDYRNK